MGKLNIFEITFANPQGVFYGGQLIQGHVTVELNAEIKMRGIRLHFEGGARVHWSEQHSTGSGKNRRTVTRHYSSSETYFNHILVLFGKGPGQRGDDPVLQAGRYVYPFSFQLPTGIPSSYESFTGRVRYSVAGVIDRPWKFDHTTRRAFTIVDPLDLNLEPQAMQGATGNGQKTLCCLCCESGPISAVLRLDRLGYVPGEAIAISGEINNGSRRKMTSSFADIRMTIQYHATTKTKTVCNTVSKISHGPILPGDGDIWNGDQLHIPPLPPSRLRGCRIIDITYTVTLNVDPSGIGFDLVVPINILIGSIPLQSVARQYGPPPPLPLPPTDYTNTGPNDIQLQPTMPSAPSNMDMPPPSYAECVFGKVNIREENDNEHIRGNMDYAPVYTYYNWNQHNANTFVPVAEQQ
ncbi:arrestin domain-containing protein 3-like [Patella vulgata]|uniref:arrestin domain-containing protein 3-like n=1 Tax=Patella vulgata TaxID=6465 RepID=UPI0024A8570A|nr:arrestin domain-containing protein 3-like [Patella vulgata]